MISFSFRPLTSVFCPYSRGRATFFIKPRYFFDLTDKSDIISNRLSIFYILLTPLCNAGAFLLARFTLFLRFLAICPSPKYSQRISAVLRLQLAIAASFHSAKHSTVLAGYCAFFSPVNFH